ncbi:MAG TPA: enoyl-CoA hydratase/isomerase family protein [Acidimicrobiales bacterium]|nr:enoyl-CoA hydratase/isomerase family protein [Acidimicrobiales bacterium]
MNHPDEITVSIDASYVATVEIRRPPNNYFDTSLIADLADVFARLDEDEACRAIVLCSEGRHFCAGANLGGAGDAQQLEAGQGGDLYREAVRIFNGALPVVAAVQGAAIGGGLGLACAADFRVASPRSRFAANFSLLGFHHGFGLTVTLPRIIGNQHAQSMLYTGRRVSGDEALAIGLCDRLVEPELIRAEAQDMAAEIARAAPLAVRSIRETLRGSLAAQVREATIREDAEQERLRETVDFTEGLAATADRRVPRFVGR